MMDSETPPATLEEADALLTTVTEDAPEPVAAEPAAPTPGQPRDDAGRFTKVDPEAEPQAAPEAAAAPAPEPLQPTEVAPETPEAVEEESYPSFAYRADGQDWEIPGSAVGEDGVFFPSEVVPELQQLLSAGKAAFGSVRQRFAEAAQRERTAQDRAAAAEAQVQQVLGHFEDLIEKGQLGPWLEQVAVNWPVLKAEAKARAMELAYKADQARLQEYDERDRQAQLRPLMEQTLSSAVQQYGAQAGLDSETIRAVHDRLRDPRYEALLFVKAPYDDPASGIRQGETVIDYGVVESAIGLAAAGRPRQAPQPAAAPPRPAPVAQKPPPTIGKGSGAPAPKGVPTFASREEADRWFERGGYNDLAVEGVD